MNQNRSVPGMLVVIGTLLIVNSFGADPKRKLALGIGIALVLAALVQALRSRTRKPE
jgi:hypothetical protein